MNRPDRDSVIFDPRIDALTGPMLERYARLHGWFPFPHPYTPYWQHADHILKDGRPVLITIPPDDADGDLSQRAYDMIRQLSQLEERPERAILDELAATVPTANGTPKRNPRKKAAAE